MFPSECQHAVKLTFLCDGIPNFYVSVIFEVCLNMRFMKILLISHTYALLFCSSSCPSHANYR